MKKFAILSTLLGLMAIAYIAMAQEEPTPEAKDNVLLDEDHQFGSRDIIEEGVPKLVENKVAQCPDMLTKRKCKLCCQAHKQSFMWTLRPHAHFLRLFECNCFTKMTTNTADQNDR